MRMALSLFAYGGVSGFTVDSVIGEMQKAMVDGVPVYYSRVGSDALISRSRSKAMSAFLQTDADVLVMVDRDICWKVGDALELAKTALNKDAVIGGMYSVRGKGMGFAGRCAASVGSSLDVRLGEDRFIPAEFIATGFAAYPRTAVEKVLKTGLGAALRLDDPTVCDAGPQEANLALSKCIYLDGSEFYPFFRPVVVPSRLQPGIDEFLSEDYSFSWRATQAGVEQLFWSRPVLGHIGDYTYTLAEASQAPAPKSRIITR